MAEDEKKPIIQIRRPPDEIKPPQAVVQLPNPFKVEEKPPANPFLVAIPIRRVVEVEVAKRKESEPREGESLSGEMAQRAVLAAIESFKNADIKDRDKFRLLNSESLVS